MKRLTLVALVVGMLAGCGQEKVQEAKVAAHNRWYSAQSRILFGLAREHLRVGQLDEAARKAQEALSLDEQNFEARIVLAKVYIEQGHYAIAEASLKVVLEQVGESVEAHYLSGVAQEKQGKLDEALASYKLAHALDRRSLDAVIAAGEVMMALGQLQEALLYIESYISSAHSEPGMYELAGRLAETCGDYAKAARYYQHATDLDYKNALYRETLVRAQFMAGQYTDAIENAKRLISNPDYRTTAWLQTLLGDCHLAINQPRHARDAYYAATELAPSDAGVWANLAKAALALQDCQRAILAGAHALDIDPNHLDGAMLLGYALLRDSQHDRAIEVLAHAVRLHPGNATVRCLLGRAHADKGNQNDAVAQYAAAVELEPENVVARELLAATQQLPPQVN